jgi:hypothetical protein
LDVHHLLLVIHLAAPFTASSRGATIFIRIFSVSIAVSLVYAESSRIVKVY